MAAGALRRQECTRNGARLIGGKAGVIYLKKYICICICICMYVCMYVCIYVYGCGGAAATGREARGAPARRKGRVGNGRDIFEKVYMYVCIYVYIYVYIYIYIHTCICIYTYMYMYMYT